MINSSEMSYLCQNEYEVDLVSLEFQLINNDQHYSVPFFFFFYHNETSTSLTYVVQKKGVKSNNHPFWGLNQ